GQLRTITPSTAWTASCKAAPVRPCRWSSSMPAWRRRSRPEDSNLSLIRTRGMNHLSSIRTFWYFPPTDRPTARAPGSSPSEPPNIQAFDLAITGINGENHLQGRNHPNAIPVEILSLGFPGVGELPIELIGGGRNGGPIRSSIPDVRHLFSALRTRITVYFIKPSPTAGGVRAPPGSCGLALSVLCVV